MPEGKYPSGFGKQDHYHNWVDAILAGKEACDPFSHGANLTEIVLCGTLAEHAKGEWLTWDREAQQTNNPAVNALLKREYRDGWKVEGLG